MLYFDGTHLMATDEAELHAKARQVGLKRKWFQAHVKHPHYDAWAKPKTRLMADPDVQKVTARDMLRRLREMVAE